MAHPARRASRALARLARLVDDEADALADLETRDTGKPLSQAKADVAATVRYLEYYAGSIERLEGRTIPLGPDALDYTVARAVGRVRPDHPVELPAAGDRALRRAGARGRQRGDRQAVRAGVDHAAAAGRVRRAGRRAARDDPDRHRPRRDRRRAGRAPGRRPRHVRRLGRRPARTSPPRARSGSRRSSSSSAASRRTSCSPTPTSTRRCPRSSPRCSRTPARAAPPAAACWSSARSTRRRSRAWSPPSMP